MKISIKIWNAFLKVFRVEHAVKYRKKVLTDWVDAILWAFVVAMIIRNYTFQNFKIPSSSMESTLLVGDYLVANKLYFKFHEPERGDIVTFRNPDDPLEPEPRERFVRILAPLYWDKEKVFKQKSLFGLSPDPFLFRLTWYEKKNIVKRVIGLPGDTLQVKDKIVYVNGKVYATGKEQYIDQRIMPRRFVDIRYPFQQEYGSRDNMGPIVIPANKYIVLGDNRDLSLDSRYWGFLDRSDITGTPSVIFFSKDQTSKKVRWDRVLKSVDDKNNYIVTSIVVLFALVIVFLLLFWILNEVLNNYLCRVNSMSLRTKLLIGDYVFYRRQQRVKQKFQLGEVIVYKRQYFDNQGTIQNSIKYQNEVGRIIGLPNDTVVFRDQLLFVNDQSIDSEIPSHIDIGQQGRARVINFRVKVPLDHYCILHDNRDPITEGKFYILVPENKVIGKGLFILYSYNEQRLLRPERSLLSLSEEK